MRPSQRSAECSVRQHRCRQYGRESRQDSIRSRTCPAQRTLGEPTNRLGLGQHDGRSVGLTSAQNLAGADEPTAPQVVLDSGAQRASRTTRGVDSSGTTGALHRALDGRSGWPHAHLRTRLPTTLLAASRVAQLHTISRRCSAEVLF